MCTNRLCGIFAVPFCVFVGVCVKNPKCDSTFGWKMYEEWLCLSHTTWMEIVIVNAATATATAIAIVVWHNRLCRIDTHRYFFIHRRTQWVSALCWECDVPHRNVTTSYIAEGSRIRCAGFDGIQPTLSGAAHLDNVRSIRVCVCAHPPIARETCATFVILFRFLCHWYINTFSTWFTLF